MRKRRLFSRKYFAENFLRGRGCHSASFLIDFLSTKVSFLRFIFLINWHRERTASLGREFVYEIMITGKWNVNPHFSVQITLPLNFNLERDILILPKCSDNEFEQKNSLSQSFSCLITGRPGSQQPTRSQIIRICMEIYLKIVERLKCTATEVFIPYKEFCLVFLLFPAL